MSELSFDVKGVLPSQHIKDILIDKFKAVKFQSPVNESWLENQLQPATLDTRLFGPIHRVANFKPPSANETVEQVLKNCSLYTIGIDVGEPKPVERNVTYVVELNEFLSLPPNIYGEADTKSTAGRNFFRCRLVTDHNSRYNKIPAGYEGKLYLEFTSMAFLEVLRKGDSIEQIRFYNGDATIDDDELMDLHLKETLVYDKEGRPMPPTRELINGGLVLTVDLSDETVGYIPAYNDLPIQYEKGQSARKEQYWQEIRKPEDGLLRLWDATMIILPTYEMPSIPHSICAKMVQYDLTLGDDKSNEAGFFDNAFGKGRNKKILGSTAVLELVVSRSPRTISHRQPIAVLKPERTIDIPNKLYGDGSTYQGQTGPRLAKQFY
ncbi:2'-deoxycytidine 5'-triphosphate deaminase [Candidatus Woesearchaeota archaeon]|nr:2'-deoxycytidine 5'-triphosphate deaminase [Candidatus Woesearchaeota archaeon]